MRTKLEKEIEADIVKAARYAGWLAYKFTSPSNRGVPDRIFFRNGKTVAIEVKRPGRSPTKLQEYELAKLRRAGITAGVATSVEEAMALLREGGSDA